MPSTTSASETAAQLKQRLPLPTDQLFDVVLENDLAGRAVLAILWLHRSQLTVHLMSEDPRDRNVVALQSALETVRNPPVVRLVSATAAAELATTSKQLVWAVTDDRTDPTVKNLLQDRSSETTWLPLTHPLAALGDRHPHQTDPEHELLLRDIIRQHASFLNFFGDRFDPRDLYERSKYPRWFIPPPAFRAAIPTLDYATRTPDGTVVGRGKFTGTLQLAAEHIRADQRVEVDLASVIEHLEAPSHDLTVHLHNPYVNPAAAGALALEVHDDTGVTQSFDIATTPDHIQVPIRAVHPGTTLTIAVVALRDNPRDSWSIASRTSIQLVVHPPGTHPAPSLKTRATAWLRRAKHRRRKGNF